MKQCAAKVALDQQELKKLQAKLKIHFILNLLWGVVLLPIVACAPVNAGPTISDQMAYQEALYQQQLALDEHRDKIDRIMRVGYPILEKNAPLCEATQDGQRYHLGIHISTASFIKNIPDVASNTRIDAMPSIVYITPGSPADKAGLKPMDVITHVNDTALDKSSLTSNLKEYLNLLNEDKESEKVKITVSRNGTVFSKTLQKKKICPYLLLTEVSTEVNAYADGNSIYITTAIEGLADKDQELALVIGHEMAHNTMQHINKKTTNAVLGSLADVSIGILTGVQSDLFTQVGASAYTQSFESEADYFGIYYTARAGYDISQAPELWRKMATRSPRSIHLQGSTHPSSAKRYLALKAAAEEIATKKQSGKEIIPSEPKAIE